MLLAQKPHQFQAVPLEEVAKPDGTKVNKPKSNYMARVWRWANTMPLTSDNPVEVIHEEDNLSFHYASSSPGAMSEQLYM